MAALLDPLATGVLPIAPGRGTKTCLGHGRAGKEYRLPCASAKPARPRMPRASHSTSDVRPTDAAIEAALAAFIGNIEQRHRLFALKIEGKRSLRSRPGG